MKANWTGLPLIKNPAQGGIYSENDSLLTLN